MYKGKKKQNLTNAKKSLSPCFTYKKETKIIKLNKG